MSDENGILHKEAEVVRDIQQTIRRQIDKRRTPLKVVSMDSGIGYPTLLTYLPAPESKQQPCAMPVAALRLLCGVIDPDLLSMLLPDGFQIVRVPENVDHDEMAEACRVYLAEKDKAHHPLSEAGREISEGEDNVLRASFPRSAA